ncbi:hypothetical protein JCM14036_05700 [Desulfotomaculum defluvii]
MPRYSRQKSESSIYHIMVRGNEKKRIFLDDQDRKKFLGILERTKYISNYGIYAYCLMDNHVHLLIKEGDENISKLMKRISVSYVAYFNRKYERVGHLFQGRFRSECIEDDSYLLTAVRYIHNNPVKGHVSKDPGHYKWSSYPSYVSPNQVEHNFTDTDFILSMLSKDRITAINIFVRFTLEENDDSFMDIDDLPESANDDKELRQAVEFILGQYGQSLKGLKTCTNRKNRDKLIREIKDSMEISVRQLSKITGLSKDIISRA